MIKNLPIRQIVVESNHWLTEKDFEEHTQNDLVDRIDGYASISKLLASSIDHDDGLRHFEVERKRKKRSSALFIICVPES